MRSKSSWDTVRRCSGSRVPILSSASRGLSLIDFLPFGRFALRLAGRVGLPAALSQARLGSRPREPANVLTRPGQDQRRPPSGLFHVALVEEVQFIRDVTVLPANPLVMRLLLHRDDVADVERFVTPDMLAGIHRSRRAQPVPAPLADTPKSDFHQENRMRQQTAVG